MLIVSGEETGRDPAGKFSRGAYMFLLLFLGITGLLNGIFYGVLTGHTARMVIMINFFTCLVIIVGCLRKGFSFLHRFHRPVDEEESRLFFSLFQNDILEDSPAEVGERLFSGEAVDYANTFLN